MTSKALSIGLHGATGKVCQEIASLVKEMGGVKIGYEFSRSSGQLRALFEQSDVLIDFSHSSATEALMVESIKHQLPLVIGTTAISPENMDLLKAAAQKVPIFYSPNFSIGVYVLMEAAELAAKMLPAYDIDIIDVHHKTKVDAPSGTALMLAQAIDDSSDKKPNVVSVRAGDHYGTHEILFSGQGESISLKHMAHSRGMFAINAIKIAKWIVGMPAGLYGMKDYLASFK